jgi:nitroreductase
MDAIQAIHERRSVRAYQDRPVERALLEALIDDAAAAPTPTVASPRPAFVVIQGSAGRRGGASIPSSRCSGTRPRWS